MSTQHRANPRNPAHRITVGWNAKKGTYFVDAIEPAPQSIALWPAKPETTICKGGFPNTPILRTLYDLIDYTCNIIDWPSQPTLLRQLAIDPVLEAYAFHANASLTNAQHDPRERVRQMLQSIYAKPQPVNLPATKPPQPIPISTDMEDGTTGARNRSA